MHVIRILAEITREIRTDRSIPILEKTIFAGGNTWGMECEKERWLIYVAGLTRLTVSLRTVLVERACNTLTTGLSHSNNLLSPFLNSSNAWACSWNIARIESGLLQFSILSARGWLRRSIPVCSVYFSKASLRRVSTLEEVEAVLEAEDMGDVGRFKGERVVAE
jgi:hypothetical protein